MKRGRSKSVPSPPLLSSALLIGRPTQCLTLQSACLPSVGGLQYQTSLIATHLLTYFEHLRQIADLLPTLFRAAVPLRGTNRYFNKTLSQAVFPLKREGQSRKGL